jgi:hypothetical protein
MSNVQVMNLDVDRRESIALLVRQPVSNFSMERVAGHLQSKYFQVADLVEAGSLEEDLLVECLAEMAKFLYEAGEWPRQPGAKKVDAGRIVRKKVKGATKSR